ncbi:MAG: carboxypeptidase-like regulatory domain-containing protein [Candidatus Aquicultor sp.]|nr:carboxypeptidase-like regulatory domain-containing protein [Candidatus Aquicultor sp.]
MKNHRLMIVIALALVASLAIAGIALAGPKKQNTSKTCPTTTSTTRCMCPSTLSSTCSTPTACNTPCTCPKGKENKSAKAKFGNFEGLTILETTITASETTTTHLANVHLRLLNSDGKIVRAAQSNRCGVFRFKNIKPGTYTLTARTRGYELHRAIINGIAYTPPAPITIKVEKGKPIKVADVNKTPITNFTIYFRK